MTKLNFICYSAFLLLSQQVAPCVPFEVKSQENILFPPPLGGRERMYGVVSE